MNAYVYKPDNTKFTIQFTEHYNRMHKVCKIVNDDDIKNNMPEMYDYITTKFYEESETSQGDFTLVNEDEDFIQFYSTPKIVVDCFTIMSKDLLIEVADIDPVVIDKTHPLTVAFIKQDDCTLVNYYKNLYGQLYYIKSCTRRKLDLIDLYSAIRENKYSFGTQIAIKYFA